MKFDLHNYKKYVDKVVYSFYSTYKNCFVINNVELNDLKQEAYITALIAFRKYSEKVPPRDLLKIMGEAVSRDIRKIMERQMKQSNIPYETKEDIYCSVCGNLILKKVSFRTMIDHTYNNQCKFCGETISSAILEKPYNKNQKHRNFIDQKELYKQINRRKVILITDALEKICNEREKKILKDIIFEGKTFQEVAEEQNQTKQSINLIYHKVINKFKKHQKQAELMNLAS